MSTLPNFVEFISNISEIAIQHRNTVANVTVEVKMPVTGDTYKVYGETLQVTDGAIQLYDVGELLRPYFGAVPFLEYTIRLDGTVAFRAWAVYCDAEMESFDAVADKIYLTKRGIVNTSAEHKEYLGMYFANSLSAELKIYGYYADGSRMDVTSRKKVLQECDGGDANHSFSFLLLDVSPDIILAGDNFMRYAIVSGERSIDFNVSDERATPNPILMFKNSFGVPEFLYCFGKKESEASFERHSAMVNGTMRNYRIKETRLFKADSGVLDEDEVEWFLELFRSEEVYESRFTNGAYDKWKEITITESEAKYDNEDASLPRYTFTYSVSQKNQNFNVNGAGSAYIASIFAEQFTEQFA